MKRIDIETVLVDDKGNQYTIEANAGDGGFSRVYKASCDGEFYAIKVLDKFDPKSIVSFKNEYDIASKVRSEHTIKYYYLNEHGHNDYPCFIIMEYAEGGNLKKALKELNKLGGSYSPEKLFEIYMQLINGMIDISEYAVHRDIKPENILICEGNYKISDYGLSKCVNEATRSVSKTMKGYGTDLYYAPELWANPSAHNLNNTQVDIYSMGIVFYEIANLTYPYDDNGDRREMHMSGAIKPHKSSVDLVFQNLINKMMARSTAERFKTWTDIKDYLSDSDIGKSASRDPFVDSLLKETALRQQGIAAKAAEKTKEEYVRIEAFNRLVSIIQSKIYNPLEQIVNEFNQNAVTGKLTLTQIEVDVEEEKFSFEYMVAPLTEDGDERVISFEFITTPTEPIETSRVFPTAAFFEDLDDRVALLNNIVNQGPRVIEYKYFKNKILLWGIIKADCGIGINVAVFENPTDPLYGILKTFLRVPNIDGWIYWIPIRTKAKLKDVCPNFHELRYQTKVDEFDFSVIKTLIRYNDNFDVDSIKDPNESNGLIPKIY